MSKNGQASERRTDLERATNAPPSAPEGVGPGTPATSGETHAYDHVQQSPLKPPLPFKPRRS
jgi:hypothetical protein